jgi:hypothetical protein
MKSTLKGKSSDSTVRIIKLIQKLQNKQHENVLSKQLLHLRTVIGVKFKQSSGDFFNKISTAMKEIDRPKYWLDLLMSN